jgi:hypothetical protein
MMEDRDKPEHQDKYPKSPEARHSYYRRCQLFRRNGDQCKAPAEKGEAICHAHAAQQAMALRRERERRAVLAEAVAQMRRQGRPECEMADLFTDFKGIQVTLAVVSRALIHGRIDCKTAGRLLVHLQTMSKLLWLAHRKGREGRKENRVVPQICADERRSYKVGDLPEQKQELLTTKSTKEHQGLAELRIVKEWEQSGSANRTRNAEIIVIRRTGGAGTYAERVHGPPDVVRAA